MTVLLVENIKLIVLYVLIVSIIVLARFNGLKASLRRHKAARVHSRPVSARL